MGGSKCLLIVDDHDRIRSMLAEILGQNGITSDSAADGAEAIERLRSGTYALVLLDLRMPHVDGNEVIAFMRETGIDTPVFVMTGMSPPFSAEVQAAQVKRVLTKPFNTREVVEAALAICARGDEQSP